MISEERTSRTTQLPNRTDHTRPVTFFTPNLVKSAKIVTFYEIEKTTYTLTYKTNTEPTICYNTQPEVKRDKHVGYFAMGAAQHEQRHLASITRLFTLETPGKLGLTFN